MYLLEGDEDEFVRFHAIQGIAFGIVMAVLGIGGGFAVGVLGFFLGFIGLDGLFTILIIPVFGLLWLAGFAAWAFLTFKAYQGERFAIPVIGSYAESY